MKNKMLNDYYLGMLYGDGYLQEESYYFFSSTKKQLADMLEEKLTEKDIYYYRYLRVQKHDDKENWGDLHIIEIKDEEFLSWLKARKMFSSKPSERFKLNSNFLRGYIETKGTFFYYKQRQTDAWRVSLTGNENDLQYLHEHLSIDRSINCSAITQRKDREDLNIISSSYRFSIQNRGGVENFIDWIDSDFDITDFLKEKINDFHKWNCSKPTTKIAKSYKKYRSATLAMAKELEIDLRGIRGGGRTKHKPVYLWQDEKQVQQFAGWEGAYEWTCQRFENDLGLNPPTVDF